MAQPLAVVIKALNDVAEQYPNAVVGRNDVGNLVFSAEPTPVTFIGYVDVITGDWALFPEHEVQQAPAPLPDE